MSGLLHSWTPQRGVHNAQSLVISLHFGQSCETSLMAFPLGPGAPGSQAATLLAPLCLSEGPGGSGPCSRTVSAPLPGPLCRPFCAEGTQADGGDSLSTAPCCPVLGASVPHAHDQGSAAETAAGVGGRTEGPGHCSATQPGRSAFPALEASASFCSSAPGRLTSEDSRVVCLCDPRDPHTALSCVPRFTMSLLGFQSSPATVFKSLCWNPRVRI